MTNSVNEFNLHFFPYIRSFIGFEKIVQMLLEKGADVNAVSDDKYPALFIAADNGNT